MASVQIKSTTFSTPSIGGLVEIYINDNKQKKSESGITSAIKTLDFDSRQWVVGCLCRHCVKIRRTHFTEKRKHLLLRYVSGDVFRI